MPRIRVEDYEDFESDDELNIDNDDPVDRAGRKIKPKPTRQDLDWEESRKALIQRKIGRDRD